MKCRSGRCQGDGLENHLHSHIIPARLMRDYSQHVQCTGVLRLRRQNLPVDRFCLRQPTGLVVELRGLKCLIDLHVAGSESSHATIHDLSFPTQAAAKQSKLGCAPLDRQKTTQVRDIPSINNP